MDSNSVIAKEILQTFLSIKTIELAKKLFSSSDEILMFEAHDITFRLYKGCNKVICFEFPLRHAGDQHEDVKIPGIGDGYITNEHRFFTPIGFYTIKKELFSTTIQATILNHFESDFDTFQRSGTIKSPIEVGRLTFTENAMIGAFSAEAAINIQKQTNAKFTSNGIDYYIALADDGDPQIFIDKGYEIDGDNCFSVFLNDAGTLYCNSDYGPEYEKLAPLKIFSMHKFY
jgi:hypothetical protein